MLGNQNEKIEIVVKAYGGIRQYLPESRSLAISLLKGETVKGLKLKIIENISQKCRDSGQSFDSEWITQSVLSNENRILQESEQLISDSILMIFPPVCGG